MREDRDPVLEELCAQAPRLLRAEAVFTGPRLHGPARVSEVALSFEAGLLRIHPVPGENELRCTLGAGSPVAERVDCAEEEPWWRVLGAPLVAAWARVRAGSDPGASSDGAEITLQFRANDSNPRFVTLTRLSEVGGSAAAAGCMAIRCETRDPNAKRLAPLSRS